MSYLIGDFGFVLAGRMNRRFGVADLFESLTRSLECTGIAVFDFGNFTVLSVKLKSKGRNTARERQVCQKYQTQNHLPSLLPKVKVVQPHSVALLQQLRMPKYQKTENLMD
jgi:hypothetical protein